MNYAAWRGRLGEANDPEFYPLAWQDELIATRRGQFWACDEAAMITEIVEFPSGARACKVFACAGDMAVMLERIKPRIEAWAALNNCTHCMIEGRDGWRRKHRDYRHHQTVIVKEL